MEIEVSKLQQITNQIFDHIQSNLKVDSIFVDKDHYWNIPEDVWTDIDLDPTQLDVGQLSDDWKFLLATLDDKEQSLPLMLLHLAPLMRYIAENCVE